MPLSKSLLLLYILKGNEIIKIISTWNVLLWLVYSLLCILLLFIIHCNCFTNWFRCYHHFPHGSIAFPQQHNLLYLSLYHTYNSVFCNFAVSTWKLSSLDRPKFVIRGHCNCIVSAETGKPLQLVDTNAAHSCFKYKHKYFFTFISRIERVRLSSTAPRSRNDWTECIGHFCTFECNAFERRVCRRSEA